MDFFKNFKDKVNEKLFANDEDYDEEIELERSLYEQEEEYNEDEDYDEFYEQQEELDNENEKLFKLMSEGADV